MPPETANPAPERATEFTVNAALPEEVNVSDLAEVVFRFTFPKSRPLALSVSSGVAAAIPVPLSATVVVLPVEESLEIVIVPVVAPVTAGSKLTCNVTD